MSESNHFEGLEGLSVRPANLDDMPTAVDFFNLYSLAVVGVERHNRDNLKREWTSPGVNLESDTRVVLSPEGDWIGYVEVYDADDPPVKVYIGGCVHPEFQGRGIGMRLQSWGEDRARKALTRLPDDVRATMRMTTVNTNQPAIRLFKNRGAKLVRRYWDMRIDLADELAQPVLPEGLRLITYDQFNDLEAVYRADDEAFQDHWGYVQEPFEIGFPKWAHWMTDPAVFDPKLWFLAMDGDELAGLVLNREKSDEDPEMGWVRVLAVRRPWRRRGLGLALLLHSFAALKQRGKKSAGLGVDSGSLTGATRLYEKAGMQVLRVYDSFEIEMRPGRELSKKSIEE
jgi:mycothiol synthase